MKFFTSAWMVLITLLILTTVRWWDPLPVEILRLKTFDLYQVTQDQKYGENVRYLCCGNIFNTRQSMLTHFKSKNYL